MVDWPTVANNVKRNEEVLDDSLLHTRDKLPPLAGGTRRSGPWVSIPNPQYQAHFQRRNDWSGGTAFQWTATHKTPGGAIYRPRSETGSFGAKLEDWGEEQGTWQS